MQIAKRIEKKRRKICEHRNASDSKKETMKETKNAEQKRDG